MAKIIRLRESGFFDGAQTVAEDKARLEKDCLMVYAGEFESMDGPVTIKDDDIEKLASNHNGFFANLKRLATGETHPKDNPPIQLDHSTSARDTVGRLIGEVKVGEYQPEGADKPVKALLGKARILGKENVEKVEDGRWVHLSGGFDMENHRISELTITPFPAAGDAHMLSKYRLTEKDGKVELPGHVDEGLWHKAERAYSDAVAGGSKIDDKWAFINAWYQKQGGKFSKLSEEPVGYKETKDKADMYAKCKKHLMEEKKMSDEDSDKHLEAAKDEELKKMSADEDERQKKLADEKAAKDKEVEKEKEAEMRRMSALGENRAKFVELSKGMRKTTESVRLAARRASITTRLSRLQAEAKITPAERKGLDLEKLAAHTDEALEAALSSYEKREPVIDVGMYGTTKAMNLSKLKKTVASIGNTGELAELQTRLRMSTFRDGALKRLTELGLTESDLEKGVQVHIDNVPNGEHDIGMEASYGQLKKLWSEGKEQEAMAHYKKFYAVGPDFKAAGGETVGPDQETMAKMSALAAEVKTMQASFDEVIKLAGPALGIKPEELMA